MGCITLEDILEQLIKSDIDDEDDDRINVQEELARTFKISHRIKRIRELRKGMDGWRSVRKSTVNTKYLPVEARLVRQPRSGSHSDTYQTPLLA